MGGGHNSFCPNFLSLPESRIRLGGAFLSHMGVGGVEEGGEYYSSGVIEDRKPRKGRVWGLFFAFGGTKTRFLVR